MPITPNLREMQQPCTHSYEFRENRLTKNDIAYTYCTACQRIVWMEDLVAALKRK